MKEQMTILNDLKNGNQEIGFAESEITIAEVLPEYAQMLCDSYNNSTNKE